MMKIGLLLIAFAILEIITILICKYLLKKIDEDYENETNEIYVVNTQFKRELRYLKNMIRQLKSEQFYGNTRLALRRIENEINQFEQEQLKNEPVASDQTNN